MYLEYDGNKGAIYIYGNTRQCGELGCMSLVACVYIYYSKLGTYVRWLYIASLHVGRTKQVQLIDLRAYILGCGPLSALASVDCSILFPFFFFFFFPSSFCPSALQSGLPSQICSHMHCGGGGAGGAAGLHSTRVLDIAGVSTDVVCNARVRGTSRLVVGGSRWIGRELGGGEERKGRKRVVHVAVRSPSVAVSVQCGVLCGR